MPIIVNRDERRAEVVALAFELIADRGVEALTFREIASVAGCSTSIVSHYFGNKNELLFNIYRVANQRATQRLTAAHESGLPLATCFEIILPFSDEARRNWRVWLAFWARAHLDPAYFDERRSAALAGLDLYRGIIADRCGAAVDEQRIMLAARRLTALIAGLGLEICFAPDEWTLDRVRGVLASELDTLGIHL
ncbi:MAG: TetR/AcrR family transcriptional regulator [Sphingopyxis sp.]